MTDPDDNNPCDDLSETAANALCKVFMSIIDDRIRRDLAQADKVRDEIRQKGTHWAGAEIWELRRQVASLRKQLAKAKQS
ncbi:hypothetical protein [Bradyrhizobium sp. STM 3557]|uniref:hypothetical protein n=1 Tax=Bradyrhizobium sp. STM 3557 TaxID=578920 RepID=UPI00388D161F